MPEGAWVEYPMEVVWEGDKRFRGGRPGGGTVLVDGGREVAPSPVEAMIVCIASCSSVDVVEILTKRRTPVQRLEVSVRFARATSDPRRLTAIHMVFRVTTAAEEHHVARAVELSVQKYCSAIHSLADDIDIKWDIEVQSADAIAVE